MFPSNRLWWLVLGTLGILALLVVAFPMYVVRPFRSQGATELALAMTLKIWGPVIAGFSALGGAICAALLWRKNADWLTRSGSALVALLLAALVGAAQFNMYERMFHRLENPEFIAASDANVDPDDMVLSVNISGQSHAYPIRMMGYHHIVNDLIGREPVVSTY